MYVITFEGICATDYLFYTFVNASRAFVPTVFPDNPKRLFFSLQLSTSFRAKFLPSRATKWNAAFTRVRVRVSRAQYRSVSVRVPCIRTYVIDSGAGSHLAANELGAYERYASPPSTKIPIGGGSGARTRG